MAETNCSCENETPMADAVGVSLFSASLRIAESAESAEKRLLRPFDSAQGSEGRRREVKGDG